MRPGSGNGPKVCRDDKKGWRNMRQPKLIMFYSNPSEVKLQSQLDNARGSCLCDLAEVCVAALVIRVKELSMVECIEHLGAEFYSLTFSNPKCTANG